MCARGSSLRVASFPLRASFLCAGTSCAYLRVPEISLFEAAMTHARKELADGLQRGMRRLLADARHTTKARLYGSVSESVTSIKPPKKFLEGTATVQLLRKYMHLSNLRVWDFRRSYGGIQYT